MRALYKLFILIIYGTSLFVYIKTHQYTDRIVFPGADNNDDYKFNRPQSHSRRPEGPSFHHSGKPFGFGGPPYGPHFHRPRGPPFHHWPGGIPPPFSGYPHFPFYTPFQGSYHDWYRAHRPQELHYNNFVPVFNEIDRKTEKDFNVTAAMDEINDDFNGRSLVTPGQYPHMAALGFRSGNFELEFKCGGSLISELFVLTAAHCCYFNGQSPDVIKLGDVKLHEFELDLIPQRRGVADIYLHPDYNSTLHYNDIALIQLSRPVEYTYFVRPIRLWARDEIPYDKLYTMGYGSTTFAQAPTNILTELDLSVVPWENCTKLLPKDENTPLGVINSQICAKDYEKNRDTCQGDSGGPLQLNLKRRRRHRRLRYYLVGITSYGTFCRSQYPGVYTRVSSYIDWIASIVWPNYFQEYFQNYQYYNQF